MSFSNQVLGTVISSVLSYDALCKAMNNESAAIDNLRSSYVPCDGRSIVGSTLEKLTNQSGHTHITNSPDLRGKFIRGLNVIYNVDQPLPFDPLQAGDPDGANRQAGSYEADAYKQHQHNYIHFNNGYIHDMSNDTDQRSCSYGNMVGDITGTAGDSVYETRPRNISVYFYIKIN
jgi:hypothetical protein